MKIAWFTPFSKKSAIGKCNAIIISELAKKHDVTIFSSDADNVVECWLPNARIHFLRHIDLKILYHSMDSFDLLIYVLGDNPDFHRAIYELSLEKPGLVILHDLVMHHFFLSYCLTYKNSQDAYLNALAYSHGQAGHLFGKAVLNGAVSTDVWTDAAMLTYHMARSAIRGSYGVVVHSQFAK